MSQWTMYDEWVARNCPETIPPNPTRAQRGTDKFEKENNS